MNSSAQNIEEKNKASANMLSKPLSDTLSHVSDFKISLQKESYSKTYPFLNKGIEGIETYRFKSKKPISRDSDGKTFLRFHLITIDYDSANSAKVALESLFSYSDPSIGLSYAWDYVIAIQSKIHWLQAPCLLSKQNWQRLITRLHRLVLSNITQQKYAFECHCGFECKKD